MKLFCIKNGCYYQIHDLMSAKMCLFCHTLKELGYGA